MIIYGEAPPCVLARVISQSGTPFIGALAGVCVRRRRRPWRPASLAPAPVSRRLQACAGLGWSRGAVRSAALRLVRRTASTFARHILRATTTARLGCADLAAAARSVGEICEGIGREGAEPDAEISPRDLAAMVTRHSCGMHLHRATSLVTFATTSPPRGAYLERARRGFEEIDGAAQTSPPFGCPRQIYR